MNLVVTVAWLFCGVATICSGAFIAKIAYEWLRDEELGHCIVHAVMAVLMLLLGSVFIVAAVS